MHRYEMLLLTVPELTSDEETTIEKGLHKIIDEAKGKVVSFERWGKYRLAYPVKGSDYGIYFLMRIDIEDAGDLFNKIRYFFRVSQGSTVVRAGFFKLDPSAPKEYSRPDSLEDTPVQDVDKFLEDNKMDGLLKEKGRGPRGPRPPRDRSYSDKKEPAEKPAETPEPSDEPKAEKDGLNVAEEVSE